MKIWTYLHTHRFGNIIYLVKSETKPSDEQVIEAHNIDFDADRDDEFFGFDHMEEESEIPSL